MPAPPGTKVNMWLKPGMRLSDPGHMLGMWGRGWRPFTCISISSCACICAQLLQSCLTLCNPMDCSPPGSSVHGILLARILEWVAMPSSRGPSQPKDWTHISCVSCIAGRFLTHWATWEAPSPHAAAAAAAAKSLQSSPTLCDPIGGSPPGSPVPGILQARTLEWVAISFSNAWEWKVKVKSLSRVGLFATPWTTAYQAPLSMGFSRQEYW